MSGEQQPQTPTQVSGVYFVDAPDDPNGLIKIGYATDVSRRVRAHQIGSPLRLRLLGVLPDVHPDVERRLHRRFDEARVRGEWFRPVDRLRRLANGEETLLTALVTTRPAAKVLRVSDSFMNDLQWSLGVPEVGRNGQDRWRFWLEDLEEIARLVEYARVRRATAKAVQSFASRIRQTLREGMTAASTDEFVDSALEELYGDQFREDVTRREETRAIVLDDPRLG